MRIIREKENQKYVSRCIFPCLQGIRMRRSEREEQKQMYNQIKSRNDSQRKKITALFKINVKKELLDQFTILPEKMSFDEISWK